MNTLAFTQASAAISLLVLSSLAPTPTLAQEDDLSCMSYRVRDKIQVAERYKEFDILVENQCPGPVYWSMCIERLDPLTHKIIESHTPSGYVENGKKARVNLQMKKREDTRQFRQRFQEFYVNVSFGIQSVANAQCMARQCEAQKRESRAQFSANLGAWEKAAQRLADKSAAECPESGWGMTEEVEACRAALEEAARPELEQLEERDAELREQIVGGDPAYCRIYAGDLVPE